MAMSSSPRQRPQRCRHPPHKTELTKTLLYFHTNKSENMVPRPSQQRQKTTNGVKPITHTACHLTCDLNNLLKCLN